MQNKPVRILTGDEAFLIEDASRAICKQAGDMLEKLPENTPLPALLEKVSTVSLFGGAKVFWIKNPTFLSAAASETDTDAISQLTKVLPQTGHQLIVVMVGKSLDSRKKIVQLLKKMADIDEYKSFKEWELPQIQEWARVQAERRGKKLAPDAAQALIEICKTDLGLLAGELEKLTLYCADKPQIEKADVIASGPPHSGSIFELSEAMRHRHRAKLLEAGERLLKNGEDPIAMIGLLAANLRLYIQCLEAVQQRKPPAEIAQKTGKNPYFIQRLLRDLGRHYTVQTLIRAFGILHETDLQIKTGKRAGADSLRMALLKLTD